ncbi:MAG: hypothetical protein A4E48_00886 [Methanosaeta sp. PtaU1.Bin060]|nr:MAG: hypothetical protein A4E48_00886 [Methanosaeta sp. PtaU1.Bin060]
MHHAFDIQIFKGYQAKSVNQITADLLSADKCDTSKLLRNK